MKVIDMSMFMLYVVIYIVFDPKKQVSVPCLRMRMRNKKFNVQTCASEVTANVFWDGAENVVSGILEDRCHNQFRAICADIKEFKQRIGRMRSNKKMQHTLFFPTVWI